jgi:hypothetical protein
MLHRRLILFRRCVANLHLSQPAAAASKNGFDRYGDPRDPKVNAVDWAEQIPFSETRNILAALMW